MTTVVIFKDGDVLRLVDGWHRHNAARSAGLTEIVAEVHDGDLEAATLYAVGANAMHGERRTNADKRHAVTMALKFWPGEADREIARKCGVSAPLVGSIREAVSVNALQIADPETRTVTRSGTTYQQKVARKKPAPRAEPASDPIVSLPLPSPPPMPAPAVEPRFERYEGDELGAGIGSGSLNDDSTATPAMGQFHRLSALLDGATVLVLHHRSKPSQRDIGHADARERGSGVIRDRADFAISLAADRSGRVITATNEKMRNGPRGAQLLYRLGEIDAGTIGDLSETTLRVVSIEAIGGGEDGRKAAPSTSAAPFLRGDTLTALRILDELQGVASARCNVATADWRGAVASALQKRTPETFRSAWKRALETLTAQGFVEIDGDRCTVSNLGNETLRNACNAPSESVACFAPLLRGAQHGTPRDAQGGQGSGNKVKAKARPKTGAPEGARRATAEAH